MKKLLLSLSVVMLSVDAVGAASCPSGYTAVEEKSIIVSLNNSCPSGYSVVGTNVANCNYNSVNNCMFYTDYCKGGITKLKTGTGKSYNIYDTKETKPALAFKTSSGQVCYSKLASGKSSGDVNIFYNGAYYHVTD